MELDPQPRRDHEQGGGAGLRKLDFFRFSLFLSSSATDIVLVLETATAQCTSRWAMARGKVFFVRDPQSSLHSFVPFPPVPVPNNQPRFCGRKAIWSSFSCLLQSYCRLSTNEKLSNGTISYGSSLPVDLWRKSRNAE